MVRSRGRSRLVTTARAVSVREESRLNELKRNGQRTLRRPDFLWHTLVDNASTLGSSRGHEGLIKTPENYRRVEYSTVVRVPRGRLEAHLSEALLAGKVRMPRQKARSLARCLDLIEALGGAAPARKAALSMPGTDAKIAFMRLFPGVGPKYARNSWMNVYHEDFRSTIAIDSRIQSISDALGVRFRTYEEHEAFYREVARDAGMDAWDLDRIMYRFQGELLSAVRRS